MSLKLLSATVWFFENPLRAAAAATTIGWLMGGWFIALFLAAAVAGAYLPHGRLRKVCVIASCCLFAIAVALCALCSYLDVDNATIGAASVDLILFMFIAWAPSIGFLAGALAGYGCLILRGQPD